MEHKFYRCEHCGNIVEYVNNSGVPVMCCGQKMTEIVPGTVDAAHEKHIPVIEVNGNHVHVVVGSVLHPMTEPHYIQWISLLTNKGIHRVELKPTDKPEADFALLDDEKVIEVVEYCNLHGLWKASL